LSFFRNRTAHKAFIVFLAAAMSLFALVMLLVVFYSIIVAIMGANFFGLISIVTSLCYLFWISSLTIFSKKSDLRMSNLGAWSKAFMVFSFIGAIIWCTGNFFVTSIWGLIYVIVVDIGALTFAMYIFPFLARYFSGVVLDGLEPHPKSALFVKSPIAQVTYNPVPAPALVAPPIKPMPVYAAVAISAIVSSSITLKSPMPGTVFKYLVNVGDVVAQNQVIAILEAMKMENEIAAPVAGTISSIVAAAGSSVNAGDVLVTIE